MQRFEDLAQRLIESSLARLFRERLRPEEVLRAIVRAIDDAMAASDQAPNHLWVSLSEQDLAPLEFHQPDFAEHLAESVRQTMLQMGLRLESPPRVIVRSTPGLLPNQIRVSARWIPFDLPETSTSAMAVQPVSLPRCPFVIVDGSRLIHLTSLIARIGRSRDNDIVIDDRRVSRSHLELRWQAKPGDPASAGRFLAVDRNSTGGTRLNGYPIAQCTLEPGDILSLGGVDVIYGEDCPDAAPGEPDPQP